VAAANQHDQKLIGNLALSDDYFGKFAANMICEAREVFHD
jgi:hypothetical protein